MSSFLGFRSKPDKQKEEHKLKEEQGSKEEYDLKTSHESRGFQVMHKLKFL